MVCMLVGYLKGIDYNNDKRCRLCESLTERDGVSHFLAECLNERLIVKRDLIKERLKISLGVEYISSKLLLDVCLLAYMVDEETRIFILNLVHIMFKIRLSLLNDHG